MVADSVPARRPVLPTLLRALRVRTRMPLSACLTLILCGVLAGGSLGVGSAVGLSGAPSPAAAASSEASAVSVELTPTGSALLSPGQDLHVTVSITNGSDEPLGAGTLNLFLAGRALTTQASLTDWIDAANAGGPGDLLQSTSTRSDILPGNTSTLAVTVPAASVPLDESNAWGARGLAATFETDEKVMAEGRGTFVWVTAERPTPVNLALAMPITTPPGTAGLISAVALETFTGPTGLLTRQLEGVIGRPVAIAIDPMIIASIRILGNDAPPSAVSWLDTLAQAPNDIFPLRYADADVSLQAQAGAGALLAPLSFDHAIDPSRFTGSSPGNTTSGTPPATPTPNPTQTPEAVQPPTTEELLAWDYTATDIAWPAEGSVANPDLPVFAAGGLTTSILSESQVTRPEKDVDGNAMVKLGAHNGLVVDNNLSIALRRAALATTDDAWKSAMAEATARLAVVSAETPGQTRTLFGTFDRGWPSTSERLRQTLDAIANVPWENRVTVAQALAVGPTSDATLESQVEPETRVTPARTLLQREVEVTAFASALADPGAVTAAHRLELLALFATGWTSDPDGWKDAVTESIAQSTDLLKSVTVTTKGPINILATQVDIPVTLSNALKQAVTVRIQLTPSNGRLVVASDVNATIDAESARTIKVPVSAKVGNGAVTLRVTVFSPTGVPISQPGVVDVNVQAEWEGVGSALFAVLVVLFFGFGVWRNIARRRRERGASETTSTELDPANGPSTTPNTPSDATTARATTTENPAAPDDELLATPVPGSDTPRG